MIAFVDRELEEEEELWGLAVGRRLLVTLVAKNVSSAVLVDMQENHLSVGEPGAT